MNILVVNVGSTSLKYTLYREGLRTARGKVERIGSPGTRLIHEGSGETVEETADRLSYHAAIERMLQLLAEVGDLATLSDLEGIGFKVVHGGSIGGTVLLSEEVVDEMDAWRFVAPGHNPPYVAAVRLFASIAPELPLVGVFETSFHAGMEPHVYTYGVPHDWQREHRVRRYGFHGASHSYIARRTRELLGADQRVVSCHLGGSSSLCALRDGRSVDVSMGFSPQGGPPQSNRCGDLDAFAVLHLLKNGAYQVDDLINLLTAQSGLLGISGLSGDIRDLERAAEAGHERARLALDVYVYEVRKLIGSYAAVLGGIDAIAFTGGIGENGSSLRAEVLKGLEFLGVYVDSAENDSVRGQEGRISAADSPVPVWVIPTDEERVVAEEVGRFLALRVAEAS